MTGVSGLKPGAAAGDAAFVAAGAALAIIGANNSAVTMIKMNSEERFMLRKYLLLKWISQD